MEDESLLQTVDEQDDAPKWRWMRVLKWRINLRHSVILVVRCVSHTWIKPPSHNGHPEMLTDAVRMWTGYHSETYPNRSEARLAASFGTELAAQLLPVLENLETEFYVSDAKDVVNDLATMGKIAARQFRERFPMLPDEIADAFAWCYTYDFK